MCGKGRDQLETAEGAGESGTGGTAADQEGRCRRDGGKTRSGRYRAERPAALVREVPGGTAGRAGKVDAGWKRQGEQGR